MRISIKFKFSIFLAVLLLLTILILSLLVLRGIKANQIDQYESYLARQAESANVYFMQTILAESNKAPQIFLTSKGTEFAGQLEQLTGLSMIIYDRNGEAVNKKLTAAENTRIHQTLRYALEHKTAYLTEGEDLYYLAPLMIEGEQVGVLQFYYSLSKYNEFYSRIRQMLILTGTGIFVLSFILAYIYFTSFANGIIKLEQMVDRVREGQYEITILGRKDEIGRLSAGIHAMSQQIMSTMNGMEEEQKKLSLAVDKLSLLDQQQKQFIGNVTHEFKTPLTSIKAYLDLLEMYPDDDQLKETSIGITRSETERLYDMVDKVLQLSTLEKYDFEYQPERIEIDQFILSILQSLSGKMKKFGIEVRTQLTKANIEADKDSIHIIFLNLLDNAIKYNKVNGKVFVKNEIRNHRVYIEISDTGIGIPKDAADRIFEPFYMVDKNRSRQSGGAGLGLSLVQRYTEKQGGSIQLLHSDEAGTTFEISFPEA